MAGLSVGFHLQFSGYWFNLSFKNGRRQHVSDRIAFNCVNLRPSVYFSLSPA